jgi:hypothetical protein
METTHFHRCLYSQWHFFRRGLGGSVAISVAINFLVAEKQIKVQQFNLSITSLTQLVQRTGELPAGALRLAEVDSSTHQSDTRGGSSRPVVQYDIGICCNS